MRIAVLVRMMAEERAAIGQQFHNEGIRGENVFAFVFRQTFEIDAFVIDRRVNLEPVFLAGVKVVGAVSRSGVHDAAALIERNVIGENSGHLNRDEGMLELHSFKVATFVGREDFDLFDFAFGLQSGNAVNGQK